MNWSREKRRSSVRASAFASTVFPTPGHVLDQDMALREQTEKRQPQRLGGRVHDRREPRHDPVGEIGRTASRQRRPGGASRIHQRPSSSRSTSSSTAAAIAGFGARGTSRSPPAVTSVTSFSRCRSRCRCGPRRCRRRDRRSCRRASPASARDPRRRARRRTRRAPARAGVQPERARDVGRRHELDLPRRAVLRPLSVDLLGGPIVGDGGRHHDHVGASPARAPRARGRRPSASRTTSTPAGRRGGQVRGQQRHAGPAPPRLVRERDPHPPDERLPMNRTLSIGSRVPPAVTTTCRRAASSTAAAGPRPAPRSRPARPSGRRPPRPRRARRSPARRSRRRARPAARGWRAWPGAPTCGCSWPARRAPARHARARPR